MFLAAPIVGFLGVVFIFFGGLLLFILAAILGILGLILFIVGLVSPGDLTVIAQAGQVPGSNTPQGPQPGYVLCPHCQGQNYQAAVHCQWCGKPMKAEPQPA